MAEIWQRIGRVREPSSLLLEARHDQRLQRDRTTVGASVFVDLLVAVLLGSELGSRPFASIYTEPRTLDVLAVLAPAGDFAIGVTLRHVIVRAVIGNFDNLVNKILSLRLDLARPEALSVVADFAENMMSAFAGDDLMRSVAAASAGKLGRPLSDIEQTAVRFEASRSLADVSDLLAVINRAGGVRCYRPAVLAAAQRALQLAASAGGPSFRDATVTIREQSRLHWPAARQAFRRKHPVAERSRSRHLGRPQCRCTQRAQSLRRDDARVAPGPSLLSDPDTQSALVTRYVGSTQDTWAAVM
jgi:hypothetical protein